VTAIQRRLQRLERSMPRPDPCAGMDEVVAGLTTPELRALIDRSNRVRRGQPTTPEQDKLRSLVEERLRAIGIIWR
jgi:hypothetical protein